MPQQVQARILWEDGLEELALAHAVALSERAALVRFGAPSPAYVGHLCSTQQGAHSAPRQCARGP